MKPTLIILAAILVLATAHAETKLTDLTPTGAEAGMVRADGDVPGKIDVGTYYDNVGSWPDWRKIVKVVPADFKLPAGETYRTALPQAFSVGGEFIAGVGLWSKAPSAYHWLEYDIPAGAKKLTGQLFVTDDPFGYVRGYRQETNQQGLFTVLADGKEIARENIQRQAVGQGSGAKVVDLNVAIPADAKKIKFRVENSGWGDGNNNTELVLRDAVFVSE